MQCPCGDITEARTFTVEELKTARNWYPLASEAVLPITITLDTCRGCGRLRRTVSKDHRILWKQG